MTADQLETLMYVSSNGSMKTVPGASPNPIFKDLLDMGYLEIAPNIGYQLTARGLVFQDGLSQHIKVGPIVPDSGAIRILMTLNSNQIPKEPPLHGAFQLAMLGCDGGNQQCA